jgi:GNAT superfamily N-acetyltransferase
VLTEADFLADLSSYTVAVEDGMVVGFCCGHHSSGSWLECRAAPAPPADWDCSYIDTLVVDEARRGQGIGSALLAEFKARATAAGMMWLMLFPKRGDGRPVQSEQLLRFYGRAGLQLLEPAEDYLRARPWMMGVPLTARPRYVFARSSATPAAAPAA